MQHRVEKEAQPYPGFYLYSRVVKAKLFIDKQYKENIDLDNIADEACFSRFHFLRLFKSIYGKTPHQYLIQVRIGKAKIFLELGHTVADVCFEVGFDSLSSFSGLFKKHTGSNPSAYRALQQQRRQEIKSQPLKFIPNCFAEQKGWSKNSNFEEPA